MRLQSFIVFLLTMLAIPFRTDVAVAASYSGDWYRGNSGLASNDIRFRHTSIPFQVRERFRADAISARPENSWIIWASAWSAPGGKGHGRAYVQSLELYALDEKGNEFPVSVQKWAKGQEVWGGCYRYSSTDWFTDQVGGQEMFAAGTFIDLHGERHTGARINTAAVKDVPAVCHIWQSRWPRDVLPSGTVKVRVKAQFVAFGDALINIGLDRYRTDTGDNKPEQEILVSDTYSAKHGFVEVVMDSAPIQWMN